MPSGGLFSWLTGGGSDSLPPLGFPLKDVQLPPSLPDYVEPGKTKITTLTNGLKIVSETSAVRPILTFFSGRSIRLIISVNLNRFQFMEFRALLPLLVYMSILAQFTKHQLLMEPHTSWNGWPSKAH